MAALSPRIAYALQEADLSREARAELRQTLNASMETMNSAAWRKLAREVGVDANALAADNLTWIAGQSDLPSHPSAPEYQAMERALRAASRTKFSMQKSTLARRRSSPGRASLGQ